MATVQVINKIYKNEETGRDINYERLAIIGSIGGVTHTLELKLTTAELLAAKMILNSDEELSVHSGSSKGEKIDVKRKSKTSEDEIDELLG